MLESPAYRVLSLSARRVLDRLDIEFAHHGGTDNGRLPVTYDDFERYGIDRHAIAPAIREVTALGFAEVTERGRAGNSEFRTPSRYRITYRNTEYARPTDDWRDIKTDVQAETTARAARKASEKEKPSGGKSAFSVRKTNTDKAGSEVGRTPTTALGGETPLLLYFGEGDVMQPRRPTDRRLPTYRQRALASLDNAIREAVRQSRLAYDFSPNSYTYGSLSAWLAAENALGVIRAQLSED
jgi:hypothetical protein